MTKAQVIALIDQYITTNGNQEITGAQTNSVMKALANQDIPFSEILSKPTTLSGYGITNAYTKGQSDGRYVNVTGDTMTGGLKISSGVFSSPVLGSDSGSSLTLRGNTNNFGLNFTNTGDGKSFIQSQKFDGGTEVYPIILNGSGGGVSVGLNSTPNSTLQVQSTIGITGTGAGASNTASLNFYESNSITNQARIGFLGATNNFEIRNEVANNRVYLEESGDVNSLRFAHAGNFRIVYHSGNLRSDSQNDARYALQSTQINAGLGLYGGGNLSGNRTLSVVFGTSSGTVAQGNHTHTFASITSKPTTLSGYGITNAYTKGESEGRYVNVTGDTMTGKLTVTGNDITIEDSAFRKFYLFRNAATGGHGLRGGNQGGLFEHLFNAGAGQKYIFRSFSDDVTVKDVIYEIDWDSGDLTYNSDITANAFYEASDRRLKDNISPLNYGLNEIEKIDTHTWNWKEDGSEDMGVIAQELELIMPELVKTNEEGYKSVNYSKLVPILINSIKELSNQVKALKNGKK